MTHNSDRIDWRSICPISCALDVLGDKWSLLIIRDLIIHESRTYTEFLESPESIATNILASRLSLLTRLNLIKRANPKSSARNNAYLLTESGKALRPILESMGAWASTYLRDFNNQMIKFPDESSSN